MTYKDLGIKVLHGEFSKTTPLLNPPIYKTPALHRHDFLTNCAIKFFFFYIWLQFQIFSPYSVGVKVFKNSGGISSVSKLIYITNWYKKKTFLLYKWDPGSSHIPDPWSLIYLKNHWVFSPPPFPSLPRSECPTVGLKNCSENAPPNKRCDHGQGQG